MRTGGRGASCPMYDEFVRVVDMVRLEDLFPPLVLEPTVLVLALF
jgi:hypothetical protein